MLHTYKNNIIQLNKEVKTLFDTYKQEFRFDEPLMACFDDFFAEADKTVKSLSNPYITIATVGTTSSGKSTILNAMIGRDIAPSDVDEMSAGILTFTPSETENQLIISPSPEGYWPGRSYNNMSDEEMKNKIYEVFKVYKEKKVNKRICTAPQIEVRGTFLWNKYIESFGLPSEVKFRFIDLPGLRKEKGDQKNLKVIQDVIGDVKPLCILAMDYFRLADPEALEVLLGELSETVKNLSGSTDSIIFLLNKVDTHTVGGATTLEENIEKFRKRVIDKLSTELPKYKFDNIKIIPFIGILYNNAQLSIGLHNFAIDTKLEADTERLYKLDTNCGGILGSKDNREIRTFYRGIEDDIADKVPLNSENVTQLLKYSYSLSNADKLLEELNIRIKDSFYEIVIYPAIYRYQIKFKLLRAYLTNFIAVNRLDNLISVYSRMYGVLESQINILGTSETSQHELSDRIYVMMGELGRVATHFDSEVSSQGIDTQVLLGNMHGVESATRNTILNTIVSRMDLEWLCAFSASDSTIELLDSIENQLEATSSNKLCFTDPEISICTKQLVQDALLKILHNDRAKLEEINEDLVRKWRLYTKYLKLYKSINGPFIQGRLQGHFQHTIDDNRAACDILKQYSEVCKSGDASKIRNAQDVAHMQLANLSHRGIIELHKENLTILETIKKKIQYDLMNPFKKVYPASEYDEKSFEADLKSKGIKDSSVRKLVEQFSVFRTQFLDWRYKTIEDNQYIIYKGDSKPAEYEYKSYDNKYFILNTEMRIAMSDLMSYNVQSDYRSFVDNLSVILENDSRLIIDEVGQIGLDIDMAAIVELLAIEKQSKIELPEDIFTFSRPQSIANDKEWRTRTIEGVCCDDYESYEAEIYKVKYPTVDGLYNNWTRGIAGSEKQFWQIVVNWVSDTINKQQETVRLAISKASEDIIKGLLNQKEKLLNGATQRNQLLDSIENGVNRCANKYECINK